MTSRNPRPKASGWAAIALTLAGPVLPGAYVWLVFRSTTGGGAAEEAQPWAVLFASELTLVVEVLALGLAFQARESSLGKVAGVTSVLLIIAALLVVGFWFLPHG